MIAKNKRMVAVGVFLSLLACQSTGITMKATKSIFSDKQAVLDGYLAKPKGPGRFPAIVLLHHCGGVFPHTQTDWPNYFTGLGYVVVTVDTNGSRGISGCQTVEDRRDLIRAQAGDAYSALDYLSRLPFVDANRVAVIGFSMGANAVTYLVSWQFRRNEKPNFAAAVAFYPGCRFPVDYDEKFIPLLMLLAEHDDLVEDCKQTGEESRIPTKVLKGAYHGWDEHRNHGQPDPFGNTMLYDAMAHSLSKRLTVEFLQEHMR